LTGIKGNRLFLEAKFNSHFDMPLSPKRAPRLPGKRGVRASVVGLIAHFAWLLFFGECPLLKTSDEKKGTENVHTRKTGIAAVARRRPLGLSHVRRCGNCAGAGDFGREPARFVRR